MQESKKAPSLSTIFNISNVGHEAWELRIESVKRVGPRNSKFIAFVCFCAFHAHLPDNSSPSRGCTMRENEIAKWGWDFDQARQELFIAAHVGHPVIN